MASKYSKVNGGFTLIELLMVVVVTGVFFSIGMPISYNLYKSYQASLRANEVMICISGIRREAFLYSERKVVESRNGELYVDSEKRTFPGINFALSSAIVFYPNGTSSGGVISIAIGEDSYLIEVKSPMADMTLSKA